MTHQFVKEKERNSKLIQQGKQLGVVGTMGGQLANDLKAEGISIIEKVPQIAEIREAGRLLN